MFTLDPISTKIKKHFQYLFLARAQMEQELLPFLLFFFSFIASHSYWRIFQSQQQLKQHVFLPRNRSRSIFLFLVSLSLETRSTIYQLNFNALLPLPPPSQQQPPPPCCCCIAYTTLLLLLSASYKVNYARCTNLLSKAKQA